MRIPKIQRTSCRIPDWVNPEVAAASIDFAIKCKVRHLEITEDYRTGGAKMESVISGMRNAIERIYPNGKTLEQADYVALGNLASLCLELVEEAMHRGRSEDAAYAWSQAVRIIIRIKNGIDEERKNAQ